MVIYKDILPYGYSNIESYTGNGTEAGSDCQINAR